MELSARERAFSCTTIVEEPMPPAQVKSDPIDDGVLTASPKGEDPQAQIVGRLLEMS
jgi:hypothetical protein